MAGRLLSALLPKDGALTGRAPDTRKEESIMVKIFAAALALVSFLLAAPIIESATSGSTQVFQAIGTADGGGGGF